MNDLQKNQAIYQAMCEIAQKYFNQGVENSKNFREFMAKKSVITARELYLHCYDWNAACYYVDFQQEKINVDTFSCEFRGDMVFSLMQDFKSLAKAKDYLFTYEEKVTNEYVGSFDITFDNPVNAKLLSNYVGKEDLRPILNYVLVEANATTGDISFVACNGQILSAVTNNTASLQPMPEEDNDVFQALFTKDDWKRICDYAKKEKSIRFEVYRRMEDQHQDTFFAVLGDKRIRSIIEDIKYPNWHKVIPKNNDKSFAILPSDVKAAQKFLQSFKKYEKEYANIFVSFYRGSDIAYFDYFDIDCDINKTASFQLTKPSDITIGTCFKISQLQKMKFTGFRLKESTRSIIVDCEESDCMVVMPILVDDGNPESYVFHAEEREVISQLATVA